METVLKETKPTLLYVTPTLPSPAGHGTSIRGSMMLEALRQSHRCSILHIPVFRPRKFNNELDSVMGLAEDITIWHPWHVHASLPYAHRSFHAIHVCRLQLLRHLCHFEHLVRNARRLILDLDDFESEKQKAFALHAELFSDTARAELFHRKAERLRGLEDMALALFDHVLVSNPFDAVRLSSYPNGNKVKVVPNAVRLPAPQKSMQARDATVSTILFVGTMDYYPNVDAVRYFCTDIYPLLKSRNRNLPLQLIIVGARPTREVLALAEDPTVSVSGEVEDVQPFYEKADITIAPMRLGGGTHIKVLESSAFRVPIVSTEVACRGLQVEDGRHMMIASSIEDFVCRCELLLRDHQLRAKLVAEAFAWVSAQHQVSSVRDALRTVYA